MKMKLICIDDHDLNGRKVKLTPGKIYNAYAHSAAAWSVINDAGEPRGYYNDVLMPLEKWREISLSEIGI